MYFYQSEYYDDQKSVVEIKNNNISELQNGKSLIEINEIILMYSAMIHY